MRRPPPKSTRTDPLVPYTPLFRSLPPLPEVHDLRWIAGAPSRRRAKGISDAASAALATEMRPFIKADDGASAEALLDQTQGLTPEATTEWRQRVAWMYYLEGDDTNARRVAATAAGDPGEWGVQAHWVTGLAAWRQRNCAVARSEEHKSELQSLMR